VTLNKLAGLIAEASGKKLSSVKIPVAPVWFAGLLCEIVCRPFGIKPPLFRRRVGFFTHDRSFDLSKARGGLGYQPKVDEEHGIQTTLSWYKTQGLI